MAETGRTGRCIQGHFHESGGRGSAVNPREPNGAMGGVGGVRGVRESEVNCSQRDHLWNGRETYVRRERGGRERECVCMCVRVWVRQRLWWM
jgi:hypothetical protein